jgi:X-Pro dipeptidyl-peptidase (S15 family)
VVVAQDVRGRYGSDCEFEPNVNQTSDGADIIAWAAARRESRKPAAECAQIVVEAELQRPLGDD